jgi:hypothetical protein
VGFVLAQIHVRLHGVNPLDVGYTIGSYTAVGMFSGLATAGALRLAELLARKMDATTKRSAKANEHGVLE